MISPNVIIGLAILNLLVGAYDLPLGIVGIAIGHIYLGLILVILGVINFYLSFKLFNLWRGKT
jgi:ABC-type spermidine/putrescine transport system permease subunit II